MDLVNQADCDDCDKANRDGESKDTLGEGEFFLSGVLVLVFVLLVVLFENRVVYTLVGANLEEDIDGVGDDEENGCDSGNLEDFLLNLRRSCVVGLGDSEMKGGWDDQTEASGMLLAEFGFSKMDVCLRSQQQITSNFTNDLIEFLFIVSDTAYHET